MPKRQTECKRGHIYNDKNRRWVWHHGYLVQRCRLCESIRDRANYRKKRLKKELATIQGSSDENS